MPESDHSKGGGGRSADGVNGEHGAYEEGPSLFHRRMMAEVDDVLKGGLRKRLERVEKRVNKLVDSNSGSIASASSKCVDEGVQTIASSSVDTTGFAKAMSVAHRNAARCTSRTKRPAFGPSKTHLSHLRSKNKGNSDTPAPEPSDKTEDVVRESVTLRQSRTSLKQSLTSREKQIASLKSQLAVCQEHCKQNTADANASSKILEELEKEPSLIAKVRDEKLQRRKDRVQDLEKKLAHAEWQAKHYQELSQQQRAFWTQTDRMTASGMSSVVNKHPCGEIFVVPKPASMADDKPEVWDVGTAVANPYVVDSWPFEPNVLARKTNHEVPMPPYAEETKEDLEEEEEDDEEPERSPYADGMSFAPPLPHDESEESGSDNY
eukprot:TRINITY_DN48236_c0_g1_i1.p1 TRINITY_DN48236_c0_g1~~TRINITY_DN48236_c0_g1_i1.p1  ORF type:complete len:436 (+),score=97.15 TRINITY_DN48236_c0_g1_i1:175-1308(+)